MMKKLLLFTTLTIGIVSPAHASMRNLLNAGKNFITAPGVREAGKELLMDCTKALGYAGAAAATGAGAGMLANQIKLAQAHAKSKDGAVSLEEMKRYQATNAVVSGVATIGGLLAGLTALRWSIGLDFINIAITMLSNSPRAKKICTALDHSDRYLTKASTACLLASAATAGLGMYSIHKFNEYTAREKALKQENQTSSQSLKTERS